MTEHPLTPIIPDIIEKGGWRHAVEWWMQFAMECPDAAPDCLDAIDAMVKGDHNRIILDEAGEPVARAFQLVRIFELDPFVTAAKGADVECT